MIKSNFFTFLFLFSSTLLIGQLGTYDVFDFIHLPSNARTNALGGSLVSVADDDVALAHHNPALINKLHHNQFSVSHEFHFAGINYGYTSYGWHLDSLGLSLNASAQYLSYGEFDRADDFGNIDGTFGARETAFTLGIAKQVNNRISIGTNLRMMNASLDTYGSTAVAMDLGMYYGNPEKRFGFGAVIKNIGRQLTTFNGEKEFVQYDVQIGMSKKLTHLPFRYSIIAHHLQQWNIRYKDPADVETDILGVVIEEPAFRVNVDNLFRHLIFSGEFLLGKREQIRLRFGYNHFRRQELSVSTFSSLAGFSFGFGINIRKIKIDYGVACYHLEGGTNQLTIRMNFVDMFRKI